MTAATTLYVLASKNYVDFATISHPPGQAYDDYYSDLDQTFSNYQMYLWLLIKYFETGNRDYATAASVKVNDSYSYLKKALEDQKALTTGTLQTTASDTTTSSASRAPINLTRNAQGYVDVRSIGSTYFN